MVVREQALSLVEGLVIRPAMRHHRMAKDLRRHRNGVIRPSHRTANSLHMDSSLPTGSRLPRRTHHILTLVFFNAFMIYL